MRMSEAWRCRAGRFEVSHSQTSFATFALYVLQFRLGCHDALGPCLISLSYRVPNFEWSGSGGVRYEEQYYPGCSRVPRRPFEGAKGCHLVDSWWMHSSFEEVPSHPKSNVHMLLS